jgi:hypothetical protein
MFKHLGDFGYKRSGKEAFGFYLAYLLIILLAAFIIAVTVSLATGGTDYTTGTRIGDIIAIIMTLVLSFTVLQAKGLLGNFGYIVLALVSGILAFLGGGILGLIPVAFLTTRDGNQTSVSRAAGN